MPCSEPLIFTALPHRPQRRRPVSARRQPPMCRRSSAPQARAALPEVSELQAVRHFTRLSQLNFSIDTHFYPLGSCTMKYNPRACNQFAMLPEFLGRHPLAPDVGEPGLSRLHVRAAGDAQGSHRHEGRVADADGRRAGRIRRRRDDSRLSPGARRSASAPRSSCRMRRTARIRRPRRCAAARSSKSRRCRTATSTSMR